MNIKNKKEAIEFLKTHYCEGQESEILQIFENLEPIYLSEIFPEKKEINLSNQFAQNIYESAYLRLLIDFGFIKVRNAQKEPFDINLLKALLAKGLFCISVDYVSSIGEEETRALKKYPDILNFLNKYDDDGNIKYIKKIINK